LLLAAGGAVRAHATRALKARGPKFRGGGSVFRNASAGGEWRKSFPMQELGCCAKRQGTKEVSWGRSAIHKRHMGLIAELRAAGSRGRRAVLQAASRGGFVAHQGGTSVRQEDTRRRRSASSSRPRESMGGRQPRMCVCVMLEKQGWVRRTSGGQNSRTEGRQLGLVI
jgi:hypothetical protein